MPTLDVFEGAWLSVLNTSAILLIVVSPYTSVKLCMCVGSINLRFCKHVFAAGIVSLVDCSQIIDQKFGNHKSVVIAYGKTGLVTTMNIIVSHTQNVAGVKPRLYKIPSIITVK